MEAKLDESKQKGGIESDNKREGINKYSHQLQDSTYHQKYNEILENLRKTDYRQKFTNKFAYYMTLKGIAFDNDSSPELRNVAQNDKSSSSISSLEDFKNQEGESKHENNNKKKQIISYK
jgi:hypothetical protein